MQELFEMCSAKAEIACQKGASGQVCWGLSSQIGWVEQLVMLVPCAHPPCSTTDCAENKNPCKNEVIVS